MYIGRVSTANQCGGRHDDITEARL